MVCDRCPIRVECIAQEECPVEHVMDMIIGDYLEVYMESDEEHTPENQKRAFLKGCQAICIAFGLEAPRILDADMWDFS